MKISYKILPEQKFMILKFYGEWNTKEYFDFAKMMMSSSNAGYIKKILTDLRHVNIEYTWEELEEVISFRDKNITLDYVNVHLVNNPDLTTSTHLYQHELSKKGYNYNYCISIQYALELLDVKMKAEEIETIIKNFK